MRSRLAALAAATALTAGVGAAAAAPAQAATWATISSSAVNKSLTRSAWTTFGSSFRTASGVLYRYCVVGRGIGSANLQPTAFGTTASWSSRATSTTRCTKAYSGAANTFQPGGALISGDVYISSVYVQRYYTGGVPV